VGKILLDSVVQEVAAGAALPSLVVVFGTTTFVRHLAIGHALHGHELLTNFFIALLVATLRVLPAFCVPKSFCT